MKASRRSFLRTASVALAAGMVPFERALPSRLKETADYRYPNPGRLVVVTHEGVIGQSDTVNEAYVRQMLDEGLMQFTGLPNPVEALESFFPGLTTSTKIAIKPNLIWGSIHTRIELVRALLRRLTAMLNGRFPAENIFFYENQSFPGAGYTTETIGYPVHLVEDCYFPDLGWYIFCDGKDRPYSKTLHDCDYLINMPLLKDHASTDFTFAMKNHFGSVNPQGPLGVCSNIKALLDINASDVVASKQRLIILDALFCIYEGGPGGTAQERPSSIFIAQDPVTLEYTGRKWVNAYREAAGFPAKPGSYIETAAGEPYSMGIADPDRMTIITRSITGVESPLPEPSRFTLSEGYPNPFRSSTQVSLELEHASSVSLVVHDVSGRVITTLTREMLSPGFHVFDWRPGNLPSGVYLLRAVIDGHHALRKLVFISQ